MKQITKNKENKDRMDNLRKISKEKRAAGIKINFDPIEKARSNPKSLRFAINAKCYDCSCGSKNEIRKCTVKNCPLYPVRPYRKSLKEEDDE